MFEIIGIIVSFLFLCCASYGGFIVSMLYFGFGNCSKSSKYVFGILVLILIVLWFLWFWYLPLGV